MRDLILGAKQILLVVVPVERIPEINDSIISKTQILLEKMKIEKMKIIKLS